MKNYRWFNKQALSKEIGDVSLPGTGNICYRAGTVNSFREGLAVSRQSRIGFLEMVLDIDSLRKSFRLGTQEYIRVKKGKLGIVVKLWPRNRILLYWKPVDYFPKFDLWDPGIEFHRCPSNLVEGIIYIEALMPFDDMDSWVYQGYHVDGNYVCEVDYDTCSRFRLQSSVPFRMTLAPMGLKRLGPRLKNRKLREVATYVVDDVGPGVIFDFGDLRIWNADLFHYLSEPKLNFVAKINDLFNFPIDNYIMLSKYDTGSLDLIKRVVNDDHPSVRMTISKKQVEFTWLHEKIPHMIKIEVIKSLIHRPITGVIRDFLKFFKLVGRETFLGYENPDLVTTNSVRLYLKNQGEHRILLMDIQ
jgi:hypothetical protein